MYPEEASIPSVFSRPLIPSYPKQQSQPALMHSSVLVLRLGKAGFLLQVDGTYIFWLWIEFRRFCSIDGPDDPKTPIPSGQILLWPGDGIQRKGVFYALFGGVRSREHDLSHSNSVFLACCAICNTRND